MLDFGRDLADSAEQKIGAEESKAATADDVEPALETKASDKGDQ